MSASVSRQAIVRGYVASLVVLGAAALVAWAYYVGFYLTITTLRTGLMLGAVCVVARFFPVSFGVGKASFEVVDVLFLSALVFGGPACALLVAAPSAVYRDPLRATFQGATHTIQIVAGAWVFALFGVEPLLFGPELSISYVYGTLAAGLVVFGLDALIGPALMRLKYGLSWGEILQEVILPPLPSNVLAVLTTLVTALAATLYGPLAVLVLFSGGALSLAGVNQIREHRKRALRAEMENAALKETLREQSLDLASQLVEKLGLRDGHASAHAVASAVYAGDVAEEMALGKDRVKEVRLAALLKDIGLLYVPDEVLVTPSEKLNSVGRMQLEKHPISGEEILWAVPGLQEAARWVRWHHERVDGTGYPDRLQGNWIPVEAKILAVSSLYASLVLNDPHSPGLTPGKARRSLVGEIGEAVDDVVARTFLRVLDSQDTAYASASDRRFSLLLGRNTEVLSGSEEFLRKTLSTVRKPTANKEL